MMNNYVINKGYVRADEFATEKTIEADGFRFGDDFIEFKIQNEIVFAIRSASVVTIEKQETKA